MDKWRVSQALDSCRSLEGVIYDLTDEELRHCLKLEEGAVPRKTVVERMYRELRRRVREVHKRQPR